MREYTKEECEKMTEDELDEAIDKKYGEDWTQETLAANASDPLIQEFISRTVTGE